MQGGIQKNGAEEAALWGKKKRALRALWGVCRALFAVFQRVFQRGISVMVSSWKPLHMSAATFRSRSSLTTLW